jgi:hypothetical protein
MNNTVIRKPDIIITSIKPMISIINLPQKEKKEKKEKTLPILIKEDIDENINEVDDEEILKFFEKEQIPIIEAFQYLMVYKDHSFY